MSIMRPITLLLTSTQVYAVPLSTRTGSAGLTSISARLRARASNPCTGVSCGSHGRCYKEGNLAGRCTCDGGWSGLQCDHNEDLCNEVFCGGEHGTCAPATGKCECKTGWFGPNCMDNCGRHGAVHGDKCVCDPGWSGPICKTYTDPCTTVDCGKHRHCVATYNVATCKCTDGWFGQNCDSRDSCAAVSCNGNGRCRDGRCMCDAGFLGAHCEIYEPPPLAMGIKFRVNSGPCSLSHNASCVGRPDGYGDNEHCDIVVERSGIIANCSVFATEGEYDFLTIDGLRYGSDTDRKLDPNHQCDSVIEYSQTNHHGSSLQGMRLAVGQKFTWTSDGSCHTGCNVSKWMGVKIGGWQICGTN